MFTGLIEAVCRVVVVRRLADTMQLAVDLGAVAQGVKAGGSIAINGVCLSVVDINNVVATFDISEETLKRSNLGGLRVGSSVNLERAVEVGSRMGGHFVQGHVDGVARIESIHRENNFADIKFAAANKLIEGMVVKGSVAVDGVSLTIVDIDSGSFGVTIIPQTLRNTTLGIAKTGDVVNVETDMIAKIVKSQLEKILPKRGHLTVERLGELGF